MNSIVQALFIMVSIFALFCLGGYILYKMGEAENTEEGAGMLGACIASVALTVLHFLPKIFRTLFRFLYEAVYEGWTGHDLPEKLIHAERILSNAEVLELVQKFKNNPYIVPSLGGYIPNYQGILWLDIKAVELALRYQSFIREDICNMADYIIQNFYMEGDSCQGIHQSSFPQKALFCHPFERGRGKISGKTGTGTATDTGQL